MSLLDSVPVDRLLEERSGGRKNWGTDFDRNHKQFAEMLASGIASQFLAEFQAALRDPYKARPNEKHKFSKDISFEIYRPKVAKKLTALVGEAAALEPFKGWLEHYSKEDKSEKHEFCDRVEKRIDYKYFDAAMHLVGTIVGQKLNELVAAKPPIRDLNTRVSLYRSDEDSSFGPSSKIRSNCVHLEAWLKEDAEEEPASGETLRQHQITRQMRADHANADIRRYVIMGLLAVMAFAVYHFGFRNR
ncbi:MAG: hypothetical protein LLG04_08260 [Parachlamydia sp.]|nr:hypothetical protein [Parachlamydia sp.]